MMNFMLSSGSDPFAHLKPHFAAVDRPAFEGVWATVEIQPEVFSRQRYCIGIAVAGHDGVINFKILDDFSKFDCLFGRNYTKWIAELAQTAEFGLLRARSARQGLQAVSFDSESIELGDLWPTAGRSADDVATRLFNEVIPFVPSTEKRTREFVGYDNATVRELVDTELKRIAGMAFEHIVCDPLRTILEPVTNDTNQTANIPHQLEFNLETSAKAGSVISAVYKTPDRVELNFLRASRDLATYSRLKQKDNLGIFVMIPASDAMPASDRLRIENVLDKQSWSLEKQGYTVSAHDEPVGLATDIFEWSELSV